MDMIKKSKRLKSSRISFNNQTRKMQKVYKLCVKFDEKRKQLKDDLKKADSYENQQAVMAELSKIPRKASWSRYKSMCSMTSRRRGYMRQFGLSRLEFRRLARQGRLPGVVKASW